MHDEVTRLGAFVLCTLLTLELGSHLLLRRTLGSAVLSDTLVQVRQCVICVIHDTFAVVASVAMALQIGAHPEDASAYYVPHQYIRTSGSILLAYFTWDLLHMGTHLRLYRKALPEQAVHHLCFMLAMLINADTTWYNYAFPVLYFGELSSVFLNIRQASRYCFLYLDGSCS